MNNNILEKIAELSVHINASKSIPMRVESSVITNLIRLLKATKPDFEENFLSMEEVPQNTAEKGFSGKIAKFVESVKNFAPLKQLFGGGNSKPLTTSAAELKSNGLGILNELSSKIFEPLQVFKDVEPDFGMLFGEPMTGELSEGFFRQAEASDISRQMAEEGLTSFMMSEYFSDLGGGFSGLLPKNFGADLDSSWWGEIYPEQKKFGKFPELDKEMVANPSVKEIKTDTKEVVVRSEYQDRSMVKDVLVDVLDEFSMYRGYYEDDRI